MSLGDEIYRDIGQLLYNSAPEVALNNRLMSTKLLL